LGFGLAEQSFAEGVESMDLVSLVEELKRQKLNSFDIIAEDEHIYAIPDENYGLVLGVYKTAKWPLTTLLDIKNPHKNSKTSNNKSLLTFNTEQT
jgi:hypothetical protein